MVRNKSFGLKKVNEMKMLEKKFLDKGLSRRAAHINIAAIYGVCKKTIYSYLTPGEHEKDNKRQMEKYYKLKGKSLREEKRKKYSKLYRSKPTNKERMCIYNTRYKRIYHHLGDYYQQSISNNLALSLNDFINEMYDLTGIKFHSKTIVKVLKPYINQKNQFFCDNMGCNIY